MHAILFGSHRCLQAHASLLLLDERTHSRSRSLFHLKGRWLAQSYLDKLKLSRWKVFKMDPRDVRLEISASHLPLIRRYVFLRKPRLKQSRRKDDREKKKSHLSCAHVFENVFWLGCATRDPSSIGFNPLMSGRFTIRAVWSIIDICIFPNYEATLESLNYLFEKK